MRFYISRRRYCPSRICKRSSCESPLVRPRCWCGSPTACWTCAVASPTRTHTWTRFAHALTRLHDAATSSQILRVQQIAQVMAPLLYHDAPAGTPVVAFVAAVLRWRNTHRQFVGGSNESNTVRPALPSCHTGVHINPLRNAPRCTVSMARLSGW